MAAIEWRGFAVVMSLTCSISLGCTRVVSTSDKQNTQNTQTPSWLRVEGFSDSTPDGTAMGYLAAVGENRPEWVYYYLSSNEKAATNREVFCEQWNGKMDWQPFAPTVHAIRSLDELHATVVVSAHIFGEGALSLNRIDLHLVKEGGHWKVETLEWGKHVEMNAPENWESLLGMDEALATPDRGRSGG